MTLPIVFKTLRTTRFHLARELEGLDDAQLLAIPPGRDDNILWNVGHVTCSLARLTYVFSGFPLPIPEHYLGLFGKGTNALDWDTAPDATEVIDTANQLVDDLESDFADEKFSEYKPLTIGPNSIDSVEEAVSFHCFHEGLHIGKIIDLKLLLGLETKDG